MSNKLRNIKKDNPINFPAKPRGTNRTPKSVTARINHPFIIILDGKTYNVNAGDSMTLKADGSFGITPQAIKPEPPLEQRKCCMPVSNGLCGSQEGLSEGLYLEMMKLRMGEADPKTAQHTGVFNWTYLCAEHQPKRATPAPLPPAEDESLLTWEQQRAMDREGKEKFWALFKSVREKQSAGLDLNLSERELAQMVAGFPAEPPIEERVCSCWSPSSGACGSKEDLVGECQYVQVVDADGRINPRNIKPALKWVYTCAAHRERESAQAATQ